MQHTQPLESVRRQAGGQAGGALWLLRLADPCCRCRLSSADGKGLRQHKAAALPLLLLLATHCCRRPGGVDLAAAAATKRMLQDAAMLRLTLQWAPARS